MAKKKKPAPKAVARLNKPTVPERGFDYVLDDFKLDVPNSRVLDVQIKGSVLSADLELTIEGASTLTVVVEDPDGKLLNSDTLTRWAWGKSFGNEKAWIKKGQPVDARIDNLPFRLVNVGKVGTQLTLGFEDRAVALLRNHRGAKSVSRNKASRAQFVKSLVSEVKAGGGIGVHIVDLKKQPIAKASQSESASEKRLSGGSGIAKGASVTVRGVKASGEQQANMEKVLDVAASHNAPEKATLALVEACIVESNFRNLAGGDADSQGVLQVRPSVHPGVQVRDVQACAALFLTKGFAGRGGAIKLARENPSWTAGKIAQACQGSAFPDRYDKAKAEATQIVSAYGGGGGSMSYTKSYQFARGKTENSWEAIGRLGEEVGWRRFMRNGKLWFVSEEDLFKQKAELRLAPGVDGVGDIDFEIDMYARMMPVAELSCQARAARSTVRPGMVAIVEDVGAANGRWLVSSISRSLVDDSGSCTITLRKPINEGPEPAAETGSLSGTSLATTGGAKGIVDAAFEIARKASGSDKVFVTSSSRPGSVTTSGNASDHSANDASRAARDIAVKGINAISGPPSPLLDKAVVALGAAFGRSGYGGGTSGPFQRADTFTWKGYRVQIIWRTTDWGGHMGHIHVGARKA